MLHVTCMQIVCLNITLKHVSKYTQGENLIFDAFHREILRFQIQLYLQMPLSQKIAWSSLLSLSHMRKSIGCSTPARDLSVAKQWFVTTRSNDEEITYCLLWWYRCSCVCVLWAGSLNAQTGTERDALTTRSGTERDALTTRPRAVPAPKGRTYH